MSILSKTFNPSENVRPKKERRGMPLEEILRMEQSDKIKFYIDPKVYRKRNRAVHGKIRKFKYAA